MTRRARLALPLAVVLALGLLAACGDDDDKEAVVSEGGAASEVPLEGTPWSLDLATLDVGDTGGAQATLRLEGGAVSGSTGCNNLIGAYTLDGDALSFSDLGGTKKACEEPLMAAEQLILERLADVEAYRIEGEELLLEGGGDTLLTYVATSSTGLVGDWTVVGYLVPEKEAFTSVSGDVAITAIFADDGTVSGNSGCNNYSGTYTATASELELGQLAVTSMACDGDGVMEQEAAYLAALQSSTSWEPTSNGVVLLDAEGRRSVELTPAS